MINPFQKILADTSPSLAPACEEPSFPPRHLTPEERASVAATNANLSGGILTAFGSPTGRATSSPSIQTVTSRGNAAIAPITSPPRAPLKGGTYEPPDALSLLNDHFFIAKVNGAYLIAQVEDDGTVKYISDKDFRLKLANMFVRVDDGRGGKRKVRAEIFWLSHEHREERDVVFDPKAPPGIAVQRIYNRWGGFPIIPRRGVRKLRRLFRHLYEVICRRDKTKFKYLISWLAWAVQNPDKNPETAIVLKSGHQGTGKTTLNTWMCRIFGDHARVISDKDRLFDRFNSDLETAVFVDADEMLWAGDRATADKLKSLITSGTITLEVKHGPRWPVPNRLHIIMTTNHDHAVQAGVQDRRYCVFEVSAHKAQDASWFDPIYHDLENGGPDQLLWFLQNLKLGAWHPRRLPKTLESLEQQRFSADTISQWAQACIDADMIVGAPNGISYPLGQLHPTNVLYDAYKGHCRYHPASNIVFGKALTQMFGEPSRQKVSTYSNSRPRTYSVPDADTWQQALDRRLGFGVRK